MSDSKEFRFYLKAMLNRDESKLLFVEANNDFVDVLLSFLTMPLGKIVRVLEKHYGDKAPAIGSLSSLYKGLQNLDCAHFWTEAGKKMLLNPRNSSEDLCRKLKLNVDDEPTKYFICGSTSCTYRNVMIYSCDSKPKCDRCGGTTFAEIPPSVVQPNANGDAGVFTENTATSIIFDDLRIVPASTGFVHCFSSIGSTDMEGAKIRTVSFGINEIIDLLKGSLLSTTPLFDIILKNRCSAVAKLNPQISPPFVEEVVSKSKKMTLKVMLQKSTNKFLFAQAEADLVDFLFSILAIPLGGVASLLQGNTCLTNIDNLYKDVANSVHDKYLITPDMKSRLIKPKLGLHYLSSNQILPLDQETHPTLYYYSGADGKKHLSSNSSVPYHYGIYSIQSPRGGTNFVKGSRTYMVTDDLVITQFCTIASFSIINRLNIPMPDVKQVDFSIGVPEALRILKASLTSRSALTDALLKPMTKKEPKQEHCY